MATKENLEAAFAGESQANRRYLAFAKKAEDEGFAQVAKLFRAAAQAETVHAHSHLRVMGGVKSTAENVEAAVAGEGYEFKDMYPKFLAEAQKEGNRAAAQNFAYAGEVEKIHYGLYSKALESLKTGKDLSKSAIWVCPVCGNTFIGEPPAECPICDTSSDQFMEIK